MLSATQAATCIMKTIELEGSAFKACFDENALSQCVVSLGMEMLLTVVIDTKRERKGKY